MAAVSNLTGGHLLEKLASAIAAIGSIHLLTVFVDAASTLNDKRLWCVVIHLTLVVSASRPAARGSGATGGPQRRVTAFGDAESPHARVPCAA